MQRDSEIYLLIDILKKKLKDCGLNYKDVGEKIGLSEISIKRIFSNYDCSLSRLNSLCKLANTSLFEVSELARLKSESIDYFLTSKQEVYFVKKAFHFQIFRLLYRGLSVKKISSKFDLNDTEIFNILRSLEKLEILDLYPDNKFKFKINGKIRLNLNGPLFNKIMKNQNSQFLERVYLEHKRDDCCLQSSEIQLSKKSIDEFVQEINDLGKKYRKISYFDEQFYKENELHDVRWLMAFMPYESNWLIYR